MIQACRAIAVSLGAAILAWQVVNAVQGRFVHDFLVPDLIVAAMLIAVILVRPDRFARIWMMVAFLATASVFILATWRAVDRDGFSPGRLLAGLGIVPCLAGLLMLAARSTD